LLAGVAAAVLVLTPDPCELLARAPAQAVTVTDRYGALLRLVPDGLGERRLPVDLDRVSPHLVAAVLAAEDRRFFAHPGIDPLAVARAARQNLAAGRVVSGGSTLTMQLARILDPHPRSLRAKLAQAALALQIETSLSKREILAAYLERAPMGNRVVGYGAAAAVYLGKPCSQLSPAEAALLAAVPRAPSVANPWRGGEALRRRRDTILAHMARGGRIDDTTLAAALAEPAVLADDPFRYPAPHFLARLDDETARLPGNAARVVSTLDPELQRRVEHIVRRHLDELAGHGVGHMAAVVLDVERGEWLAVEGSGGFSDRPGGQLDGSRAARQPGSALKPFTYATGFDRVLSPATVLPDVEHAFAWSAGTWTPRNYDDRFHGPLRARAALGNSVNVPAAHALAAVGPAALLATLRAAGITTLDRAPEHYGLGLTLGGGEVRLDELTGAFAALLRGGEWLPATAVRARTDAAGRALSEPPRVRRRVCSAAAAAQVVDILADPEARAPAFGLWSVLRLPFAAAVKTGTSEGFRDNWCVGGTREVAVGVWCGNFDRAAMGNVSGVAGAGAAWREIMLAWAELAHPGEDLATVATLASPPPELERVRVCALSGLLPGPDCPASVPELLLPAQRPRATCDWHRRSAGGRTVVAWPPLYRDWAARQGLVAEGTVVAAAAAPASVDPTRGAELAIAAPADGDAFVLSPELPRRFQSLELRCAAAGAPPEVVWLIDGREHARAASPYTATWRLEPGEHRIQAAAGRRRSAPVRITVLGE
jgi:penicillin-binding protein 1C